MHGQTEREGLRLDAAGFCPEPRIALDDPEGSDVRAYSLSFRQQSSLTASPPRPTRPQALRRFACLLAAGWLDPDRKLALLDVGTGAIPAVPLAIHARLADHRHRRHGQKVRLCGRLPRPWLAQRAGPHARVEDLVRGRAQDDARADPASADSRSAAHARKAHPTPRPHHLYKSARVEPELREAARSPPASPGSRTHHLELAAAPSPSSATWSLPTFPQNQPHQPQPASVSARRSRVNPVSWKSDSPHVARLDCGRQSDNRIARHRSELGQRKDEQGPPNLTEAVKAQDWKRLRELIARGAVSGRDGR